MTLVKLFSLSKNQYIAYKKKSNNIEIPHMRVGASQVALEIKNLPANAGDIEKQVRSLGWEDPLEKDMATPFSILAWRIP